MIPPYIPPKRIDSLKVKIPQQTGAPLIVPLVPKGVKVLMDIMLNLRKLYFADHDMKNHRDLELRNYMDIVQDTPEAPK